MIKFILYFLAFCVIAYLISEFWLPLLIILAVAAIIYGIIYVKRRNTTTSASQASATFSPTKSDKISPSLPGSNYNLAYHYDDVMFYPPVDMVSKVNKKLLFPGAEVSLKPEPKNKYDNRAIALYVSGHQIGYLRKGTLQDMAHDYMAKQWPIKATLSSLNLIHGEYQGYISLSFYRNTNDIPPSVKRLGYHDIDIHSIHPTNPDAKPNTPLTGKNIVFSGCFTIPLNDMMQIAVDAGAVLKSRVSKSTAYLVVGTQGQSFVDENGMSGKESTATKLNSEGQASIQIISENTFLELSRINLSV